MTGLERILNSIKKNGLFNTLKFILIILLQEIKRFPREIILQSFAKKKFLKNNIQFPKYMSNHKIKKISFFNKPKWGKGLPNGIDYLDQNNLINLIYKKKPKVVLEIGSGYSTYSIINTLLNLKKNENHNFKFYCLDQNKEYLNEMVNNMPNNYKKNIVFIHREIFVKEFIGQKMSFFDIPDEDYDFIYEDRKDHPETKIAGDIIKYDHLKLKNNNEFFFTIDGMITTANFYKKNLKNKYKHTKNYLNGINFYKI